MGQPGAFGQTPLAQTPPVALEEAVEHAVAEDAPAEDAENEMPGTETGLHGVLMCNKIVGSRVTLGARVLALLAEKGFQGASKWEDFVYVGTQKDRCTNAEIEHFKTETLESLNRGCGGSIRSAVTISINENDPSRTDVTELVEAIARMRGHTVTYKSPGLVHLNTAVFDLPPRPPVIVTRTTTRQSDDCLIL